MKWLVTGARGQLGLALTAQLASQNIDFVALNSKQLDITKKEKVDELILAINPQVIVNAAAWTNVDRAEVEIEKTFAVNVVGVKNLVLAAQNLNSIFINISTDYVFSGNSAEPWSEKSPINPQNVYGQSKAEGELVVGKLYPERSYILRTAWLYSENGRNFAKTMCKLALKSDGQVRVVRDQIGQPTNVHDLALQIILIVKNEIQFGVYHCTNSGQASWFEFAQEVFRLAGADVNRVLGVPSSEYPTLAKRPTNSVLGHEYWGKLGFTPMRDWKNALGDAMPAILISVKLEQ